MPVVNYPTSVGARTISRFEYGRRTISTFSHHVELRTPFCWYLCAAMGYTPPHSDPCSQVSGKKRGVHLHIYLDPHGRNFQSSDIRKPGLPYLHKSLFGSPPSRHAMHPCPRWGCSRCQIKSFSQAVWMHRECRTS